MAKGYGGSVKSCLRGDAELAGGSGEEVRRVGAGLRVRAEAGRSGMGVEGGRGLVCRASLGTRKEGCCMEDAIDQAHASPSRTLRALPALRALRVWRALQLSHFGST